ncbi:hypothetical protein J2X48_001683 [Bosea sp. BE271]|uniref:hypothetical protein n=1 Tax=Bosea TaxID=85413 RepID=UPI002742464E|nr:MULTISPECIES: hypothetical protein [Bosea]MDR6827954.1 hypothetical protein [Bosea robiniae]MDR6894896.1 hypothetical protein [Bosea sp. BE109]MDR7138060.1 hypothetical protein [Bosea sp. BE168]MDR7174759.1 hypothetical protein [Bosea sp. BE271]
MKNFIATFDIELSPGEPQDRFLQAASEKGWSAVIDFAGQLERLPSNTLIGQYPDLGAAHRSFDEAIVAASETMAPGRVTITRRFIVERVRGGRLKALRTKLVETNIARLRKFLRAKTSAG